MAVPEQKSESTFTAQLLPRLGLLTATMIVVGNLIGSGIFKKSAPMADQLQSPGLLLICWLVAGIVSLIGALANAEVAGLIADPGGLYSFFKKMYGRVFAYIFGWSCFAVILAASNASIAYVFGQSANSLLDFSRFNMSPEWEQFSILGTFFPFANFGVKAFTILTVMLLTTANYFGVIFGGAIATISSMLKIAGIAIVVIFGIAWSGGSFGHLTPVLANPNAHYLQPLGLFGAFFVAFRGAFWAYDGWINITFMGGEIKSPKRNIPLALAMGVGGVIVVYMLVNLAYLHVMSIDEMAALAKDENAIIGVEAMRKAFGGGAAQLVAVLIMLSTFGATNCQMLQSSRVYFSMARDRLFFQAVAKCHPKYRTPSTSLVLQGVWTSVLVLSGTFDQLSDMVIFASFIFYGASAFGVFVLRRTMKDAERPYRMHGYPILPALFVVFCMVLVVVTIVESPRNAIFGLVLMVSGLPFYLFWDRQSKTAEK